MPFKTNFLQEVSGENSSIKKNLYRVCRRNVRRIKKRKRVCFKKSSNWKLKCKLWKLSMFNYSNFWIQRPCVSKLKRWQNVLNYNDSILSWTNRFSKGMFKNKMRKNDRMFLKNGLTRNSKVTNFRPKPGVRKRRIEVHRLNLEFLV